MVTVWFPKRLHLHGGCWGWLTRACSGMAPESFLSQPCSAGRHHSTEKWERGGHSSASVVVSQMAEYLNFSPGVLLMKPGHWRSFFLIKSLVVNLMASVLPYGKEWELKRIIYDILHVSLCCMSWSHCILKYKLQHLFRIALSAGVISLLHVELLSEQNHCQKSYLSYCEVELLCFMLGCRTCTAFHFLLWAHISLPPHTITGWQLNRGEVFKVSLSIDFFSGLCHRNRHKKRQYPISDAYWSYHIISSGTGRAQR